MCGIVGLVSDQGNVSILMDGLSRLEYRGYDSAGVAFQNGKKKIDVYKTKGRIADLARILPSQSMSIISGLGHTRWATHGEPSTANAHPHVAGSVTVVHNGIIENYRVLRRDLESDGQVFLSQTDTEVVPRLIERNLRRGMPIEDAIREAVLLLRGSYALGILHEDSPGTLFAVRKGSPLVIGTDGTSQYIASDVPALLSRVQRFFYLEDGQLAVLRRNNLEVKDLESLRPQPLDGKAVTIDWTPAMAEKQGFEHFMRKEIHEQHAGVRDTLREWISDSDRLISELGLEAGIRSLRRIHIAACGTSFHAGLIGRYLIEKFARIPVAVDIASEFRYMSPVISKGTLFVSITQSGETADTLAALREARAKDAYTCTICNVVGSTATRESDAVLYTRCGPEIGVASTKAFTSQLASLCLLGLALGVRKNRVSATENETIGHFLQELPGQIERTLEIEEVVRKVAETLVDARSILFLGRGINYPVALEGALKMKELSYIHAEGYPAGEMKHGPIALIERGSPTVFLAPIDELHEKVLSNIEEVKARGGRVIAVTDSPAAFRDSADELIVVPTTHPVLLPFLMTVPLQLLAYHVAVLRGSDVDQPRNLAKSVTVE